MWVQSVRAMSVGEDDDALAGLKLAAARKVAKEKQRRERGRMRELFAAVECTPMQDCGPSRKSSVLPCVGTRAAVKAIDRSRGKQRGAEARPSPSRSSPRWLVCCAAPAVVEESVSLEDVRPGRVELPSDPDRIEHRVGDFPSACVREISDPDLRVTPLQGRRRLRVKTSWCPEREDTGYLTLRQGDTIVLTAETERDWWSGYVESREWVV